MNEPIIPVKVALVDDQELFMESLTALFGNTHGQVEVLWTARSGEEALLKAQEQPPEVVLLDYFFKGKNLDGGETCRLLRAAYPDLKVLILSVSCDLSVIRESLQKGALGYASKEISKSELLRGIQAVAQGDFFLDQTVLREVVRLVSMPVGRKQSDGLPTPTARELDVARLYAKGLKISDIATHLFISDDTVESHIKNLRSKTGASSRYEVGEYLTKHVLWE